MTTQSKIVYSPEVPSFTPRRVSKAPTTALPLLAGLAGAAQSIHDKTHVRVTTLLIHHPVVPLKILSQDAFRGKNALPGSREDLVNRGITTGKVPPGVSFGQDDSDDEGSGDSLSELATSNSLDDNTILNGIQGQAASLLAAQNGNLYTDGQQIWQAAVAGAATGAGIGVTATILGAVLSQVGFEALADVLAELVSAIATAITEALVAVGAADIVTATAAGGSFGYVGAVIGAIIGACIALGNILYGGQHCQITDGRTFSCKDYIQTNVQNASTWLNQNPHMIMGLTVVAFAQVAALFYAQPTWLYRNQALLGGGAGGWGPPPDPGTGDALDLVYTEVPGAYELLNRAQFMAACSLVNSTPQHLNFYRNIYKPVPGQSYITDEVAGTTSPGNKYGTAAYGQGVYPDPNPENGWASTPTTTAVAWGIGEKCQATLVSGSTSPGWLYTACPNLMTNNNVFQGKPFGTNAEMSASPRFGASMGLPELVGMVVQSQTDVCPGIYNLQVLYPALTTTQCEMIFAKCSAAYSTVPQDMAIDLAGTSGQTFSLPVGLTKKGALINYLRQHGGHKHPPQPPQAIFVKPGTPWVMKGDMIGKIIMSAIPPHAGIALTTVEKVPPATPVSNVGPAVGSLGLGAAAGIGAAALGVPALGAGAIGLVGAGTLFELLKKK